jgi:hypothetical protein
MMTACNQCPWRVTNHGKRNLHGFYTKKNLTRMWNGLRTGHSMSCHPTDPSRRDHQAQPDSIARECSGAVILIQREIAAMADPYCCITDESSANYLRQRRMGLTRSGIFYWLIQRYVFGGKVFIGDEKLPETRDDSSIQLPDYLKM